MRTLTIVVVAILLLAGGWWLFGPHIPQWGRDARNAVDRSGSDEHTAGIYEAALSQAEQGLRDQYRNIYSVKLKAAEVEAGLKVNQEKLTKEEQILRKAKEVLEKNQPGVNLSIGGVSYTWEQVNEDALQRTVTCQVLQRNLQNSEQSLSKLRKAYEDGVELIRQKQDELRHRKIEFEAEKAELAALHAEEEVNEIIGKVYSSGDIKTDLGRARKIFEQRLNERRANAEYDQKISLRAGTVSSWDRELGTPREKATEAIQTYFQQKQGAPVSTQPSVSQALEELTSASAPVK